MKYIDYAFVRKVGDRLVNSVFKRVYNNNGEKVVKYFALKGKEPQATITINPTPPNANVVLRAEGFTQTSNSIKVDRGTLVECIVTAENHTTYSENIIANKSLTLNVELKELVTIAVNPIPTNASVVLELV